MQLKELLDGLYDGKIPSRFEEIDVQSVGCDSRTVEKNSLFVALKGVKCDGADFILEALQKGAKVVVADSQSSNPAVSQEICFLNVDSPKKFLLNLSKRFYNYPSKKIKAIGITGTNGKTTISYLVESILQAASRKCAVLGTINYRIDGKIIPSKNTTPGLLDNQKYLADMVEKNIGYCVMEVSSHALDQGRVEGIDFSTAIFTNLTGDHMDYHQDMENYFMAKALLFRPLKNSAFAIVNVDDNYGPRLRQVTEAKVLTYGFQEGANFTAKNIQSNLKGSSFLIKGPDAEIRIETKLIGRHNIYNILAACAAAFSLNVPPGSIKHGIESLQHVPGRLEQIDCGQDFHVFVDYAHTEDALKNVLTSLKRFGQSKIILVFGCGGDRDKTKRPEMGKVASELADLTILTNDNPRNEIPENIVGEIMAGHNGKNCKVILDREEAIKNALLSAAKSDIVLIAGKGHEDYQIFNNKTVHFDDCEVVRKYITC